MGRKPKPPGEHYRTTVRQLGRIPDEEWEVIQRAVKLSGKTLTEWAKSHLLRAANREVKKS